MTDFRRALPSVSALLESAGVRALLASAPRALVVDAVRDAVAHARAIGAPAPEDAGEWVRAIADRLAATRRPSLRPVLNATGVVLHTNLGRAPLPRAALDAIALVASGYSNLEYDLDSGKRGSRYVHCAALLAELTGAEDALVVNNCAAALVLVLNTVAEGREAILSRGELVEIGGSFRIHEIMAKSGARLCEVGATNRTHLADYTAAMGPDTAALLKVHRSNFEVVGYTAEATVRDLVPLVHAHDIPIIHDLGSGLLIPLDDIGLTGEPTARDALAAGAGIVTMSGDKLLGGPQAGLILGEARYIAAMRANPFARSYRVDKLTLAALEATLALYRDPEIARREIPTLALLGAPIAVVRARATWCLGALRDAGVTCAMLDTTASVGAGAFPTAALPSVALSLAGDAERWVLALRAGEPAVVGRVQDGNMLLDLRAVQDADLPTLVSAVVTARD
ncbi:MAG TPA: L-seryl-tRNA(Sec) selenium transferase [Gemmatimonadaceae bacterium]|nr:L-seryl-tRNA(Sec) selenium transferase [Gemmatimonadaceae bacterium]